MGYYDDEDNKPLPRGVLVVFWVLVPFYYVAFVASIVIPVWRIIQWLAHT